jgi:DNA-binding response OmpR family regulator
MVRDALSGVGYSPLVTGDPEQVPHLIRTKKPKLVLMDLMLPGTDGIELMEQVPEMADLPVIFISAYGRDEIVARALQKGAADYIVKPFSQTELTARVRATLRRAAKSPEPFRLGEVVIDYARRRVTLAGNPLELTATEFDLLRVLSVNAGRVVTFDTLLRQVWRKQEEGDPRLVRTYVKRVRRKLGDDAENSAYIFSIRGVGYHMAEPSEV